MATTGTISARRVTVATSARWATAAILNVSLGDELADDVHLPDLVSIALTPKQLDVDADWAAAPSPISFTATGTFQDGHTATITAGQLGWTANAPDDTPPGSVTRRGYTPFSDAGGAVTITATDGCITGTTTITLQLDVTIGTPTNPSDWTPTPVATGTLPTLVYPSDQTRFPRNIYRTLFR